MAHFSFMNDRQYMQRALELARKGLGEVSPNPMVGAVIVDKNGRIIGEGWHRKFGEAHAEVNACNSVPTHLRHLLSQATIYVTLEPCAHFGKTPPCADLLVEKNFRRVVIGSTDPFHKVHGEGIRKLKNAGIDVEVGVMEEECRALNKTFFFAHTTGRPFVTLKWAQSADGWMDSLTRHPFRFSNSLTQLSTHRLRSQNDAIITSTRTVAADDPLLDSRLWPDSRSPRPVIVGSGPPPPGSRLLINPRLISYVGNQIEFREILTDLYRNYGITSALVEGGPRLLGSFIEEGLWEEARVEVNPVVLAADGCHLAPDLYKTPVESEKILDNTLYYYRNY